MKNKIIFILIFMFFCISLLGCQKDGSNVARPYFNKYDSYSEMEEDLKIIIDKNNENKSFLLFKENSYNIMIKGICPGDNYITKVNDKYRCYDLKNYQIYLSYNYDDINYMISLFSEFEISDLDKISYTSNLDNIVFDKDDYSKSGVYFIYNNKPIINVTSSSDAKISEYSLFFLELLKEELVKYNYVK